MKQLQPLNYQSSLPPGRRDSLFSYLALGFGIVPPAIYFSSFFFAPFVLILLIFLGVILAGAVVLAFTFVAFTKREPLARLSLIGLAAISSPLWVGYLIYLFR